MDIACVESLIDKNTIGLVGIAGNTEFGQVDPIEDLSRLALQHKLFLHIDAAFGGFVIPFLEESYPFDFEVPGVTSIAIDPHKMGLSTIPSGALLFRSPSFLDSLKVSTPYLTTKAQFTLTGTRKRSGGCGHLRCHEVSRPRRLCKKCSVLHETYNQKLLMKLENLVSNLCLSLK